MLYLSANLKVEKKREKNLPFVGLQSMKLVFLFIFNCTT